MKYKLVSELIGNQWKEMQDHETDTIFQQYNPLQGFAQA